MAKKGKPGQGVGANRHYVEPKPVTESLSLMERLVLLQSMPKEGHYLTIKILSDLKKQLAITPEEQKAWEYTEEKGQARWNEKKSTPKDVLMGEIARGQIIKGLKALEEAEMLYSDWLPVYERFVPEDQRPKAKTEENKE